MAFCPVCIMHFCLSSRQSPRFLNVVGADRFDSTHAAALIRYQPSTYNVLASALTLAIHSIDRKQKVALAHIEQVTGLRPCKLGGRVYAKGFIKFPRVLLFSRGLVSFHMCVEMKGFLSSDSNVCDFYHLYPIFSCTMENRISQRCNITPMEYSFQWTGQYYNQFIVGSTTLRNSRASVPLKIIYD